MTDYVLVHGGDVSTETWNSLTTGEPVYTANGRLGGRVWETVTPIIQGKGHRTFTPTLIDEHNCNLHGHIEQICLLITENNLNNIVLAGHSYGGMIITGVASQIPDVIGKLVYLDAAIPDPGQSLFDFLESNGNDPLTGIPGLEPAMAYVDKLQFNPQIISPINKFFIRCTRSELASFIHTSLKNIKSDPDQWMTFELEAGHVCQPTAPDELAKILLQIDDL